MSRKMYYLKVEILSREIGKDETTKRIAALTASMEAMNEETSERRARIAYKAIAHLITGIVSGFKEQGI